MHPLIYVYLLSPGSSCGLSPEAAPTHPSLLAHFCLWAPSSFSTNPSAHLASAVENQFCRTWQSIGALPPCEAVKVAKVCEPQNRTHRSLVSVKIKRSLGDGETLGTRRLVRDAKLKTLLAIQVEVLKWSNHLAAGDWS